ncbi:hypothetical protein [Actinoplanes xinjiangensis]|uniref:Uncharacterized protein n=1 Tax=Actinoplanes xinjiangensis TaxID=512350 RepID=A0A316EIQ7_9ACTN|nr:hypothetical protein [Actinoplanes xinjiangensis]PWK30216.1 hypothetical protein BC793_14070 [Actinoplanes xinjiangensis]GIF44644.1 hypothetical protein Axi01nite_89550 [Actinoplanes xinjiangensis]
MLVPRTPHQPDRPTWDYLACGEPWPCALGKAELAEQGAVHRRSLRLYLESCAIDMIDNRADGHRASDSPERKAIIEELIAEIRIIGDEIIPVFRLPRDEPVAVDAATPATSTGDGNEPDPVRAMPNLMGRTGLEPVTDPRCPGMRRQIGRARIVAASWDGARRAGDRRSPSDWRARGVVPLKVWLADPVRVGRLSAQEGQHLLRITRRWYRLTDPITAGHGRARVRWG